MTKQYLILTLLLNTLLLPLLYASTPHYTLRKYSHVKEFYRVLTPIVLKISKEHNIPPAAILAVAGLESGYGSGYVAQITGNILSLGAYKSDAELPALTLPYSKSKKRVLFDPKEIQKQPQSDLSYRKRAPSLKRDYRPHPYAGTQKNLELLKYDKKLREQAYKRCVSDFATRWLNSNSKITSFKDARVWLDTLVAKKGYDTLLLQTTNEEFIDHIGGKPHSFNYRKSWPIKVKYIMHRAGLISLVKSMQKDELSFDQAWAQSR